ncbi:MAG: MerR family transcriptional regulator, partial [Lachnospiraceae bacterium]|nr:MerR family transcriptional regulator [Lachnospiraceae bacterium]
MDTGRAGAGYCEEDGIYADRGRIMKKYFKIGEISKMYHIGTDSLRYYEKIGILKPKRGENQYRLYRTEDIWRLNVIRELRELGFTMEQIGGYLRDHTADKARELLEDELRMIEERQKQLGALKKNVEERVRVLAECKAKETGKVKLCKLPDRRCHYIGEGYQSVIFCGQFNTILSASFSAPTFRFCPLSLSYLFPALW